MDFSRGERVRFDLETGQIDPTEAAPDNAAPAPAQIPAAFVGDILERTSTNPPTAPTFKPNASGFPTHKKRTPRVSAFKQQRASRNQDISAPSTVPVPSPVPSSNVARDERQEIDLENKQRLDAMSAEEIEQERNELFSSLPPSLIQKLLARANLDEASNEQELFPERVPAPTTNEPEARPEEVKSSTQKTVSFEVPDSTSITSETQQDDETHTPTTGEIKPTSSTSDPANPPQPDHLPNSSIHFPKPPQPPDLDPSSPSFLTDLHEKYFPNLSYDPSSLSWMTPVDPSDTTSPYHPNATALNAADLRFNFKGALLAPSKAREIPVTEGLHHHAEAPEAAGYTIPELAILARSAVPAQRCMAYQTLGRILYRLGQGEFGVERRRRREYDGPVRVALNPDEEEGEIAEEEDVGSVMASGLWKCVEEGRVVETLTAEAARERGHRTAKAYAEEALWNWRRGGGRRREAV